MSKIRVRWTEEEKDTIKDIATEVYERNPLIGGTALLKKSQTIALSQGKLKRSRNRTIASVSQFKWFIEFHEELVKSKKVETKTEIKYVQCSLSEISTDELLIELGKRMFQSQFDKINSAIEGLHGRTSNSHIPKKEFKLKKALIIGLKGDQVNIIKEQFDNKFKLSFQPKGDQINTQSLNKDYVIVMKKFCTHPQYWTAKTNAKYTFKLIDGGITGLMSYLNNEYKNGN